MPKYLQRMGGLFALFFVQFQAAASGGLPMPAGIPCTVQEWAVFCAYFTAAFAMHIPMLRRLLFPKKCPAPAESQSLDGETPETLAES